jgi:CheY-like chemotaxis protein
VNQPHAKVLLVEDSKFLRLANERILTKAGYVVTSAGDGEEALRFANEKLPDIILLDMILPKMSGPDVLRKLKESPATAAIPVIVISSLSQKNEKRLLDDGAAAYFEKSNLDLENNSDWLATAVENVLTQANKGKQTSPMAPAVNS